MEIGNLTMKIRSLLSIFLFVLTTTLLCATDFRVGLLSSGTSYDSLFIKELSSLTPSEHYRENIAKRLVEEERDKELNRRHRQFSSSGVATKTEVTDVVVEKVVNTTLTPLQSSSEIRSFALSQSFEVLDYLLHNSQLDLLVIVDITPTVNLFHIQIATYERDNTFHQIEKSLIEADQLEDVVYDSLLTLLHQVSSTEYGTLVLEEEQALSLYLDGVRIDKIDEPIIVPAKEYTLRSEGFGYESKEETIVIEKGQKKSFRVTATQGRTYSTLLSSYEKRIDLGDTLQLPAVINSFAPYKIISLDNTKSTITIDMSKERSTLAMDVPYISIEGSLLEAQKRFYSSFGKTLLLTGVAIALQSITTTFATTALERSYYQPFILAGVGFAGVSGIDSLFQLFAYYRKTKYSSLYLR